MPMTRHVLSVCIFCFICATHSPCASHATIGHESPQLYTETSRETDGKLGLPTITDRGRNSEHIDSESSVTDANDERNVFLRKIFEEYGDGDTMSMDGFARLLKKLDKIQALQVSEEEFQYEIGTNEKHESNQNATPTNCTSHARVASFVQSSLDSSQKITRSTLDVACPALLHSVLAPDCGGTDEHHLHMHELEGVDRSQYLSVWLYSTFAVIVISACGALALIVIPVMQKKFYKPLLQFLVALAVGTLAGDALLHLLPHAMSTSSGHGHGRDRGHGDEHEDHENMWKGFVAMLGLTFFFLVEKSIPLVSKWKRNRNKNKNHSHVTVLNTGMDIVNTNDTQCNDKYNPYNRCYKDIVDDPHTTFVEVNDQSNNYKKIDGVQCPYNQMRAQEMKIMENGKEKNETNQNLTECPNELNASNCTEVNKMLPHEEKDLLDDRDADYTVILREHGSDHHGHSHTHGHVHAAPKNFSSVAWMVIMGDGLHNFTDGMAIGAAFSNSLAGGFSTAVAVFCHELPHELGDFAMLLKAGMSIQQALYYNFLSSILCILGNLCGIWLGNTEYASTWVFAVAAGTFIYIALVDMIPELSSAHEDEGDLLQCFLHLGGLVLGFGIMTVIALFEHDLKNIFNDPV